MIYYSICLRLLFVTFDIIFNLYLWYEKMLNNDNYDSENLLENIENETIPNTPELPQVLSAGITNTDEFTRWHFNFKKS